MKRTPHLFLISFLSWSSYSYLVHLCISKWRHKNISLKTFSFNLTNFESRLYICIIWSWCPTHTCIYDGAPTTTTTNQRHHFLPLSSLSFSLSLKRSHTIWFNCITDYREPHMSATSCFSFISVYRACCFHSSFPSFLIFTLFVEAPRGEESHPSIFITTFFLNPWRTTTS